MRATPGAPGRGRFLPSSFEVIHSPCRSVDKCARPSKLSTIDVGVFSAPEGVVLAVALHQKFVCWFVGSTFIKKQTNKQTNQATRYAKSRVRARGGFQVRFNCRLKTAQIDRGEAIPLRSRGR